MIWRLVAMIEDLDNMLVAQAAGDIGLAREALDPLRILREQQLDCDQAIFQRTVPPQPHLAHATFADLALKLVVADTLRNTCHNCFVIAVLINCAVCYYTTESI